MLPLSEMVIELDIIRASIIVSGLLKENSNFIVSCRYHCFAGNIGIGDSVIFIYIDQGSGHWTKCGAVSENGSWFQCPG